MNATDIDIAKLSPLQLASTLMTTVLVECLNALKTAPTTEALTVARQSLQGLRFPIGPVDSIDEGLALELRSLYLKRLHEGMNAPEAPTAALLREVLRFGNAVGLLGGTDGNPGLAGRVPMADRLDGPSLLGEQKPALDYSDLPFFSDGSKNPKHWGEGLTESSSNMIEHETGGPQMMRAADYQDLPFKV